MNRPHLKPMLLSSTLLGIAAASLSMVAPASAQETTTAAAEKNEDVVVITGTRIAREGLVSSSPVMTVGQEELELKQPVNVEELLRNMPQFQAGNGGQVNNGSAGASTIDLRGLTTPRTLPLIDGKRMVGYDPNGLFDVSSIPLALLKRVDVVTGGASAVYGSDAIAGVVNFILDDEFKGLQFDANYGITDHGDGETENYQLTMGSSLDDGRGSVVFSLGYLNREAVYQIRGPASLTPGNSSFSTPARFDAAGGQVQFGPTGDLVAPYQGFNFNPQNLYQSPQRRWNGTVLAKYDFNDSVEAYARFIYNNSQSAPQLASSLIAGNNLEIQLNNPFLNAQASNYIATHASVPTACSDGSGNQCVSVPVRWRARDVGPRQYSFTYQTFQALGGLRGDLMGWNWDVSAAHGETSLDRAQNNDISLVKIQQALFASDASTCTDATGGCVPLNLFNPAVPIDPAALAFIRLNLQLQSVTKQDYVTATIGGDLGDFKSPMASNPIGVALGAEYRMESSDYKPDFASQADISPGFGATLPIFGEYDVSEVFGEAIIPLVEGAPFADSINLELGYRTSDYSTSGRVESYKAGADWSPVSDLRFRTMFQRAVRAANISELYSPPVPGTGDLLIDQCATGTAANPITGALRALCIATGVPAGEIDNGTLSQPTAGQVSNLAGGNPNLTPEEADTFTAGFVWQPDFVPGLSLTMDYYDITVNNAIALRPAFDIMAGCYSAARNPTLTAANPDCAFIVREPLSGGLTGDAPIGVQQLNLNIGEVHAEGVDYSVRYGWDLGTLGSLDAALDGTFVMDSSYVPAPGAARVDCVGHYGKQCGLPSTVTATTGGPTSENHFVQRTTWNYGDFSFSYLWRYLSSVSVDPTQAADTDAVSASIPAYNYIDLGATWQVNDWARLKFSVTNVFDKEAPFVVTETGSTPFNSGNTYPSTYDVLGRVFTVGVTTKF
ncbi:MAG: TonB-dependent receptor [Hyphomonadaceae bacterium]